MNRDRLLQSARVGQASACAGWIWAGAMLLGAGHPILASLAGVSALIALVQLWRLRP